MLSCHKDNRSFFEKLQNAKGLDLRDDRGKRHELAVVLSGVSLALLSNPDGSLSSIHRHLKNHYERLMTALKLEPKSAISRPQLPRVLEAVAVEVFDQLLFAHYGIKLKADERKWFAVDGKELRGSIEKGATLSKPSHTKRGTCRAKPTMRETKKVKSRRCAGCWKRMIYWDKR